MIIYHYQNGSRDFLFNLNNFFTGCANGNCIDPAALCHMTEVRKFYNYLTLKASITTAEDEKNCYIFPNFRRNQV